MTNRDKQIRNEAELYFNKIYNAEKNCRAYQGSAYAEGFLAGLDPAAEAASIGLATC